MRGRILLIGWGYVGSNIFRQLSHNYDIIVTFRSHEPPSYVNAVNLDIRDKSKIDSIMNEIKPDSVILSAAIADVDFCEVNRTKAWDINVKGAVNVARACKKTGTRLIYLSTNYVFGDEHDLYHPQDPYSPLNYYGLTKAMAEEYIMRIHRKVSILRLTRIYGGKMPERNFIRKVITSINKGHRIYAPEDHYNNPVYVEDIARSIDVILREDISGIYHIAGPDTLTLYEIAELIATFMGRRNDAKIVPVKTEDIYKIAKRPKHAILSIKESQNALGIGFTPFTQGLELILHSGETD